MSEQKLYTSRTITDYIRRIAGKFELKKKLTDDERSFLIRFLHEYSDNRDKRAEAHFKESADPDTRKKNALVVSNRIEDELCRLLGKPAPVRHHGGDRKSNKNRSR